MKIEDIEGIGSTYAAKFHGADVQTTDDLLKQGGTAKGRADLAAATGLSEKQILDWVNRADLYRVNGIGSEFADLLEAAGVDTVAELAQRSAENLAAKLKEVNDAKSLVRNLPGAEQIGKWVEHAKSLPKAIEY